MKIKRTAALSAILFTFWIILVQSFEPKNLIIGLFCAIGVALASQLLLAEQIESLDLEIGQIVRLGLYFPYLLLQIVKANVNVAEIVLDPRLPISPIVVKFKFPLTDDLPQVTLANSITLTPGTLTIDIQDDTFFVHCLAEHHAQSIFDWNLQERTMRIYTGPVEQEPG